MKVYTPSPLAADDPGLSLIPDVFFVVGP